MHADDAGPTGAPVPGIESLLHEHGFDDVHWMAGAEVVVGPRVRLKCMCGCENYGKQASCPPNVPGVQECRELFRDYSRIAVIHIQKALKKGETLACWSRGLNASLVEVERAAFLAGFYKALLLYAHPCSICRDCKGERTECRNQKSSRPVPEALAVDVFATARKLGFPIQVLRGTREIMNRYAFLLVE